MIFILRRYYNILLFISINLIILCFVSKLILINLQNKNPERHYIQLQLVDYQFQNKN